MTCQPAAGCCHVTCISTVMRVCILTWAHNPLVTPSHNPCLIDLLRLIP